MSRKGVNVEAIPSKKPKLSPGPSSSGIVETEKLSSGFDKDLLKCPICSQFPRAEVYQCIVGHSVCANCLTKLNGICPSCQGLYWKTRNYLAEGLLDSMKFQCSWKENGCTATPARNDLTSHETQCDFNPNSVKFCYLFEKSCNRKFCPVSTKDPKQMTIFLVHLKVAHPGFTVRDVNPREPFFIHFKYSWSVEAEILLNNHREPCFLNNDGCHWVGRRDPYIFKTILRLNPTQANQEHRHHQYYVLLCRFVAKMGHTDFSFKCVRLSDDDDNQDWMSLAFSLTGRKKAGPKVPELSWTVKPQAIRQLKDFWIGNQIDDLTSYNLIPLSFVLDNYLTEEGIPVKCVFN